MQYITKENLPVFKYVNILPAEFYEDAENDLSMLNDANEGVFMCNSKDSVIHLGKHFTYKTSDEDGVVDYLEKMHPELWK